MLLENKKLLRVNLSKGTISKEEIDLKLVKEYLGGRGLASKYLTDEISPSIKPFSVKNKLIFANGLLTGTTAPTGGRYVVVTKGPLTGTIASSNSGGFFGAEMARAGYGLLIVEGKAKRPSYLSIVDNKVKILDASDCWGLNTHETTDLLLKKLKSPKARVACIGPAGEKLSKIACIINDKNRAAGRTGVGAVMGSKNLKAIVIKGSGKIETKKKEQFKAFTKNCMQLIKKNPVTGEGLPALGTKVLDNIINEIGAYPTKNFQLAQFDGVGEMCGEALVEKGYLQKKKACFACPISCGRDTLLPNGRRGEGPEYETGWAFGSACGVSDLIAITEANFLCNELGLDTISTGATIACAMELYEKGYLPKKDLGKGPELKFGSSEAIVYYTRKIGLAEAGIGKKLAEGSYRFAESYGHPELSMTVKKQELPAYDPRGVQGQGLAYATSNRGGCHVRAYLISPEVLGLPQKLDMQKLEEKPQWVKIFQDLTAVIDSSGLCLFTSFAMGGDNYRDLFNAALGAEYTTEDILAIGERIWEMERVFNLAAGITPEDDTLPERLTRKGLAGGPQKGSKSKFKKILGEYYTLRGWTKKGLPKR